MHVRTWSFSNFNGLTTEPAIKTMESGVDVHWEHPSNRTLVEGVLMTGDKHHQVMPQNVIPREDGLEVKIGVNTIDVDIYASLGRYVPYELEVELIDGFPDEVVIVHRDKKGEIRDRVEERNPKE